MNPRYAKAAVRAAHRCEYCHAPEAVFNFPFEVEHITPPGRDGPDDESNWALSCRSCNLYKSDAVEALDPQSAKLFPLFHPRRDRWEDHFVVEDNSGMIIGITSIGRATIAALRVNKPAQIAARRYWIRLQMFPSH